MGDDGKFSYKSLAKNVKIADIMSVGAIGIAGYTWYNLSTEIKATNERVIKLSEAIKRIGQDLNKNINLLDLQLRSHLQENHDFEKNNNYNVESNSPLHISSSNDLTLSLINKIELLEERLKNVENELILQSKN